MDHRILNDGHMTTLRDDGMFLLIMKKYYAAFLSAFGLFAMNVQAQDFTYSPSQDIVATVAAENFDMFQIDFATPSFEAITYHWERVSNTFPAEWTYSLCDYGGCYVRYHAPNRVTC